MPLGALIVTSEGMLAKPWSRSPALSSLRSELGPLLDEATEDFALGLRDGNGGKFSRSFMGCTFCGADFTLGRSFEDSPPTCGDARAGFVPLCWDEGPGASTTCGVTGGDCSRNVVSLLATRFLIAVVMLKRFPIAGRRKDLVEAQADGF